MSLWVKLSTPRDFIMALPKPEGHMGLNEFFPDNDEMDLTHASQVTIVPPEDAQELRNYEDDGEKYQILMFQYHLKTQ